MLTESLHPLSPPIDIDMAAVAIDVAAASAEDPVGITILIVADAVCAVIAISILQIRSWKNRGEELLRFQSGL